MKNYKSFAWASLLWAINIKIILIITSWTQIKQIFDFSNNIFSFYKNSFLYFYEFTFTIPAFTFILSFIFAGLLYYFWYLYFKVYFNRLPSVTTKNTGFWGIFASVFAFLGFGCVACGQTLITSLLLLLVGSGSTLLAESVGNLSIILGIIIVIFGIRKNLKMYKDRNICKI